MQGHRLINNFVFVPLIGFDGQSNGLIQMINFKNNVDRLQIRKYAALSKFLGCCLDRVILSTSAMTTCINSVQGLSFMGQSQDAVDKEMWDKSEDLINMMQNVVAETVASTQF